jgi:hypothetical protein
MLLQLVCLDRRFQRMNCFNIREVEALLKTRFFADLVNSLEHRSVLNSSMIGIRFKTNNLNIIHSNMSLFHTHGIFKSQSSRPVLNFWNSSTQLLDYEFYVPSYFTTIAGSYFENTTLTNLHLSLVSCFNTW